MSKERLEIIKKLRETILEENDFRTIHDIQSLISKMESGEYFEEFTK